MYTETVRPGCQLHALVDVSSVCIPHIPTPSPVLSLFPNPRRSLVPQTRPQVQPLVLLCCSAAFLRFGQSASELLPLLESHVFLSSCRRSHDVRYVTPWADFQSSITLQKIKTVTPLQPSRR